VIELAPLLASLFLLCAAPLVARTAEPRRARRRATLAALGALLLAAVLLAAERALGHPSGIGAGVRLELLPTGLTGLASLVTSCVALLAVAMAPLASHPPATQANLLRLFAIASAFLAFRDGAALAALWALSAWVAWRELRSREATRACGHLFALHQGASAALMVLGVALLSTGRQLAGGLALALAIGLREAILPLHLWFPTFVQRAPLGVVVAFAAPQLGVHAHLELLAEGMPIGLARALATCGSLTAVVAAILGVVQIDARRALAFLIMSQTGLVTFGLGSGSELALAGAIVSWQVLALATSGFAMTLAALEARRGSLSLLRPSGSFARTPRMAVAFLFLGFASVGLPMTLGFVAEDLLVQGSVDDFPLQGFALIAATAVNGMTVMRCFFALFSGSREHRGERDLTRRESFVLSLVMAMLLLAGLLPGRLLSIPLSGAESSSPRAQAAGPP
jgi:formate hydrogenlyase subunit 3/multisubunit Na+/H+ antiporter MnhD subunit